MRIVQPSVVLEAITKDAELLIERAGRTCYKSDAKITSESAGLFIRMIIKKGHESVIEHASATLRFVCDRGVTHELVRHRLASFSQESTRYCNYSEEKYGGEISVICPPSLEPGTDEHFHWHRACEAAERAYIAMLSGKISPQIARSVLPICLKTEIVVTANLREWRHIFKLRTAPAAHPQIRSLMKDAKQLLYYQCPNVFKD